MTRSLVFWGVAVMLPVLHFLLHVGFGLGAWAPDLLTVGTLLVAREVRAGTAAGVGFGFGLLADAFSVLSFGANALALTVVGTIGARTKDLFLGDSVSFLGTYLAVGVWLREAIHWAIARGTLGPDASRTLLVEAPLSALYTAVVGGLILLITGAWSPEAQRR